MERRFYFGVGLLAVLLVISLLVMGAMAAGHEPVSDVLDRAAREAVNGNMDTGVSLALEARDTWENIRYSTASAADHTPMDEIDALFAELEVYADTGEDVHFAACCAQLSKRIQSMSDAHALRWWNLL